MLDLILEGGTVIDGTGRPRFRADVGIAGGKISQIAPRLTEGARTRIDAAGMVVAPGFIDVHSHSDFTLFSDPCIYHKISQGITTEICGNCGISAAPIRDRRLTRMQADVCGNFSTTHQWETFDEYLRVVEGRPLGTNIGWLIGYNTVREYVGGVRPSISAEETAQIRAIVADAMKAGAFGMSSGLVYEPGNYAAFAELCSACEPVAKSNGIYASHTRGLRETLLDGVYEAIEIARRTKVAVEVSHMTPQYGGWELIQPTMEAIDGARQSGIEVAFDLHLDSVGGTSALATLPPHLKADGVDALVNRLQSTEGRTKAMKAILDFVGPGTCGFLRHGRWDLLRIDACPGQPGLSGRSIEEIALTEGKSPWDVYFDALVASRDRLSLAGLYTPVEYIKKVLVHPLAVVATDAVPTTSMPRNWSTMPKLFGDYVRKERTISLETAVLKVTSMPAERYGLAGRGRLAEGYWADAVVFDPDTVGPTVTDDGFLSGQKYPDPACRGVHYVLVNGMLVVDKGKMTGALNGTALFSRSAAAGH